MRWWIGEAGAIWAKVHEVLGLAFCKLCKCATEWAFGSRQAEFPDYPDENWRFLSLAGFSERLVRREFSEISDEMAGFLEMAAVGAPPRRGECS